MRLLSGLLSFVFGGLLFAVGITGFVAAALSSPVIELWGRLGRLSLSLWPAVMLLVLFFILFLAGVYLMKASLARKD